MPERTRGIHAIVSHLAAGVQALMKFGGNTVITTYGGKVNGQPPKGNSEYIF